MIVIASDFIEIQEFEIAEFGDSRCQAGVPPLKPSYLAASAKVNNREK